MTCLVIGIEAKHLFPPLPPCQDQFMAAVVAYLKQEKNRLHSKTVEYVHVLKSTINPKDFMAWLCFLKCSLSVLEHFRVSWRDIEYKCIFQRVCVSLDNSSRNGTYYFWLICYLLLLCCCRTVQYSSTHLPCLAYTRVVEKWNLEPDLIFFFFKSLVGSHRTSLNKDYARY